MCGDTDWIPTPEEIRERCLAIQEAWTQAERQRRSSGQERVGWRVPGSRRGSVAPVETFDVNDLP